MANVLPGSTCAVPTGEFQVRLIYKRCRLQCSARLLAAHVSSGESAKMLVDSLEELVLRTVVTARYSLEQSLELRVGQSTSLMDLSSTRS